MLTGTGVFDGPTSTWSLNSSGLLGSTGFGSIGSALWDPAKKLDTSGSDETDDKGKKTGKDTEDLVKIDGGKSNGVEWDTVNGKRSSEDRKLHDVVDNGIKSWNWDLDASDIGYLVSSAGTFSSDTGGSGNIRISFTPVPEPGSATLLGVCLVVMCGIGRRMWRGTL